MKLDPGSPVDLFRRFKSLLHKYRTCSDKTEPATNAPIGDCKDYDTYLRTQKMAQKARRNAEELIPGVETAAAALGVNFQRTTDSGTQTSAFRLALSSSYFAHVWDVEVLLDICIAAARARDVDRFFRRSTPRVFLGHGHSSQWLVLEKFLRTRLNLDVIEFNSEPAAGLATSERLESMIRDAHFAFILMTAEDEHADGQHHARENVVHEVGLLQGRLGFRKAIVLLEEGCAEFSNILGLGQIRFPAGKVGASFEEVRSVLEREGILAVESRGSHDSVPSLAQSAPSTPSTRRQSTAPRRGNIPTVRRRPRQAQ
jgi:hypothetical protein